MAGEISRWGLRYASRASNQQVSFFQQGLEGWPPSGEAASHHRRFFPGHSSLPKHFRGVARGCVYDGMEWNGDGRKKEGRVICDDMDGAITSTCVCVCVCR